MRGSTCAAFGGDEARPVVGSVLGLRSPFSIICDALSEVEADEDTIFVAHADWVIRRTFKLFNDVQP